VKEVRSMAASIVKLTSTLILKVNTGVDVNGNDVYKNIAFKKVKSSATSQDVLDVANGIALVLRVPVDNVLRQSTDEIIEA
jgi:hypothetical protein